MEGVIVFSLVLVIAGFSIFTAGGLLLLDKGEYGWLAGLIVTCGVVTLFGGLLWALLGRQRKEQLGRSRSWYIGLRVCGITSLFLWGSISVFLLYLVLFHLHVNAPFRADYDTPDSYGDAVQHSLLSNGLRYSIVPAGFRRDKFSALLRIDVGSLSEPDELSGLAHVSAQVALTAFADKFASLGARVRLHTSLRTTIFKITDVSWSHGRAHKLLSLLQQLALVREASAEDVHTSLGIIRGEERVLNTTRSFLHRLVFCNHFGVDSKACLRLPYQRTCSDRISTTAIKSWYAERYVMHRMHVFVAGDFDVDEVSSILHKTWAKAIRPSANIMSAGPSGHQLLPAAQPTQQFLIHGTPGVTGLEFVLVITRPYDAAPHDANFHRMQTLNRLFYGFLLNMLYQSLLDLDYTRHALKSEIRFRADVSDEYQLNATVHSIRLSLSGAPRKGGWRPCVEMLLMELRRLAERGPDNVLLGQLLEAAHRVFLTRSTMSRFQDSSRLVQEMAGNYDPNYVYLDAQQEYGVHGPFLNGGFHHSSALGIQAEARFMWNGLVSALAASHDDGPLGASAMYADVVDGTSSLSILTGAEVRSGRHTTHSYVSHADVRALVVKILETVLEPRRVPPMTVLEDVFLKSHSWHRKWDQTGSRRVKHYRRDHVRVARLHLLGDFPGSRLPTDGLPKSGFIVDPSRLELPRSELSQEDNVDDLYESDSSRGGRTQQEAESKVRAAVPPQHADRIREYELLETFPRSGVQRFRLANGLHVSLKQRLSGFDRMPCDATGGMDLEVVSIGGKSSEPQVLKGACELVGMDVASGYAIEYWTNRSTRVYSKDDIVGKIGKSMASGLGKKSSHRFLEHVYVDRADVDTYMAHGNPAILSDSTSLGRPIVRCEREFFSIRTRLLASSVCDYLSGSCQGRCETNRHNRCDEASQLLMRKQLESVRLSMSPLFDANSVERASTSLKRELLQARHSADALKYIKLRARPTLLRPWRVEEKDQLSGKRQSLTSPPVQGVTPSDISALDPVQVGLWVREQFTVDRMEVNVVGDFNVTSLMHWLNLMLGTMPLERHQRIRTMYQRYEPGTPKGDKDAVVDSNEQHTVASPRAQSRVGRDVYNPLHEGLFRVTPEQDLSVDGLSLSAGFADAAGSQSPFAAALASSLAMSSSAAITGRSSAAVTSSPLVSLTRCTLPSLHPGRVHVMLAVRTNADFTSARGHQRGLLTEAVLRHALVKTLRRQTGFVYKVSSTAFSSWIYPRFGYYEMQWVVGTGVQTGVSSDSSSTNGTSYERRSAEGTSSISGGDVTQIAETVAMVQRVMARRPAFDQETFDHAKELLISQLQGSLQDAKAWLAVMRGLSLRPPVWRRSGQFNTIQDITASDQLWGLEKLSLADVNRYWDEHIANTPILMATVTTVPHAQRVSSVLLEPAPPHDMIDRSLLGAPCEWHV